MRTLAPEWRTLFTETINNTTVSDEHQRLIWTLIRSAANTIAWRWLIDATRAVTAATTTHCVQALQN